MSPRRVGLVFSIAIQRRCILDCFRRAVIFITANRDAHITKQGTLQNYAAVKYLILFTFGHGALEGSNEDARMRAGSGQREQILDVLKNPEVRGRLGLQRVEIVAAGSDVDAARQVQSTELPNVSGSTAPRREETNGKSRQLVSVPPAAPAAKNSGHL